MKKLLSALTVLTVLTVSHANAMNHGDRDHHHGWKDNDWYDTQVGCPPPQSVPDAASTAGLAALAFGAIVIGRHFTRKNA